MQMNVRRQQPPSLQGRRTGIQHRVHSRARSRGWRTIIFNPGLVELERELDKDDGLHNEEEDAGDERQPPKALQAAHD